MAPNPLLAGVPLRVARGRAADRGGLVLLALAVGWTAATSVDRAAARPVPVLALLGGSGVLVAAGRLPAAREPRLVPALVAVAVAGSLVLGYPDLLRAGGGPTGYANSNGALAALGAIAASAAAAASAAPTARRAWLVLSVGLGAATVATGSIAATLALVTAGGLVALAIVSRQLAVALIGGVVAASITLGVTASIAAGGDPLGLGGRSDLRGELWSRGLDVLRDEPWRGVGPGAYAETGAPGVDPDLRWAHHGYLQQGAEQGMVGLLLLLALIGWVYARLWEGRGRSLSRTLAGAAAATTVGLHAAVDHVLHDAAVPLTLALLVGWATADRRDPTGRGTPGSRRPLP